MKTAMFLTVFLIIIYAGLSTADNSSEETTPTPCDDASLMTCFLPVVAFAMSDEGAKLGNVKESDAGSLTQAQLTTICGLALPAGQCISSFIGRCIPKNYTDIHRLNEGTTDLLKACQEPDLHSKIVKLMKCSNKTDVPYERCKKNIEDAVPKNVTEGNYTSLLKQQHIIRDLCCNLKKYGECFLPETKTLCTADEASTSQAAFNRIFNAYKCTEATKNCPAGIAQ